MKKNKKLEIMREIEDIIIELDGISEIDILKSGINMGDYMNPSEETLEKLRIYRDSLRIEDRRRFTYGK